MESWTRSENRNYDEDWNDDGVLWPGNVFSVNVSATTNSKGYAVATLTYPQGSRNGGPGDPQGDDPSGRNGSAKRGDLGASV